MTGATRLDDADTAVIPVATRPRHAPRRRTGSAVLALLVIAATVLTVQIFLHRTISGVGRATYAVSADDRWLEADSAAASGYFRLDATLGSQPVSAVLWLQARDQYQVWVNGHRLIDNRNTARIGTKPVAGAVDIGNELRAGRNVVAIQATSLGEGPARIWARVSVQLRTGAPVVLGTNSPQWRSTANSALVGAALGQAPEFINPSFSLKDWGTPRLTRVATQARATVPPPVLELPFSAVPLTTSRPAETDAVFATTLALPPGTSDVWIRVAATGGAVVLLNGNRVASLPNPGYVSPTSHRTAAMTVLHVGSRAAVGSGDLRVHVTGDRSILVLDALAHTRSGWQKINTDLGNWKVTSLTAPVFVGPPTAGVLTSIWPHGFSRAEVAAATHVSLWRSGLVLALSVLVAGLLALGAALILGGRSSEWLWRLVVFAALPVLSLTLLLATLSRWTVSLDALATSSRWNYLLPITLAVLAIGTLLVTLLSRSGTARRSEARASEARSGEARSSEARSSEVLSDDEPATAATQPFLRRNSSTVGVLAIAAFGVFAMGWRLWRQPLWQDEATSIAVARAIKGHGLPRLASGLLYFKAEFYHGLIAAVLGVTSDVSVLRVISLLWYGGTLVVFGLLLMPVLAPGRRGLQLLATAGMVLVPAEQVWARDVRMYQQMQFFSVLFLAFYLRALVDRSRRYTAFSALALLAMYLSHEESFVLLPAVAAVALLSWRSSWELRWVALRWYGPVGLVIAAQYLVSQIHPPDFGSDLSNRPYLGWDPHQGDYYYQRVFFSPLGTAGSLTILSTLALVAIGFAVYRHDRAVYLIGSMGLVTTVTTSLLFTAKVSRYSFVVMPMLIALAVLGAHYLLGALAAATRRQLGSPATGDRAHRVGFVLTSCLLLAAVLATLGVTPRDYGLLAADVSGAPNPYLHPDYRASVDYLKRNERAGDVVITLSPPVMTRQYLGRSPDRIIQTGRNKLLYVIYRKGVATDTILGVPVLLTAADLRRYTEQHSRVWLVSDTGSLVQGVPVDLREEVARDFAVVYQNGGTSVSLRDAG